MRLGVQRLVATTVGCSVLICTDLNAQPSRIQPDPECSRCGEGHLVVEGTVSEMVREVFALWGKPAVPVYAMSGRGTIWAFPRNLGNSLPRICYDPVWVEQTLAKWGKDALLGGVAHEVGHHVTGIRVPPSIPDWSDESRADYFAGATLARLGRQKAATQAMLRVDMAMPHARYPPGVQRAEITQLGYEDALKRMETETSLCEAVDTVVRRVEQGRRPPIGRQILENVSYAGAFFRYESTITVPGGRAFVERSYGIDQYGKRYDQTLEWFFISNVEYRNEEHADRALARLEAKVEECVDWLQRDEFPTYYVNAFDRLNDDQPHRDRYYLEVAVSWRP